MKIPDSLKLEEFIYSSDGRYIAYHKNENIILFDLKSNKEVKSIKYNNYIDFNVFTFSKDNKSLLISISEYQNYLKKDYYKLDIETSTKFIKITQNENKKLINNGKELLSIDGDYSYKVGRYSINLWDNKNNKNLLDIVAFDDNEWLSITSEGYFNSSAKAPKYLNVLTTPMDVSSIDQYFETFYRPDIMKLSLSDVKPSNFLAGQDKIVNTELKIVKKKVHKIKKVKKIIVIPTLKLSDVKPAPQVAIIDTKTSIKKEELKVTLRITPSSGGIGQIRLYLDGVLIKTDGDRGLKKKQNKNIVLKTYTIKLPKGKHTLKAIVYNEANTMASREDTLAVTSTYNPIVKPNIYAVIVGINEYKNPTIALKYAVADAKLFAKTIKKRTKGLYGDVNIKLLISKEQTSKEHITKTLKNLENISSNDLFIFFVASHGMIEDAKYHMITSNVGALSSRGIKREAIGQNALRDMIANIPTTKKFIILDTCNSGALGQAIEVALLTRGLTETTAMKVLSRAVGSTIISASSSSQEALEGYKGHGLLTYVLTDGLNGKADSDRDGYIKTLEIANFVEDMVPEIAEREFKRAQYPFISPLGQGFPLVKVK
ncbi:caspase family protein [Sulfurimonas sp.]|uniref:caspase family protein n=1 Tax=Sulfurimonas sp. TaxID=2022749 RepID=UPI002AB25C20|nr:caspase family protein [Sulfurimonas sp.]